MSLELTEVVVLIPHKIRGRGQRSQSKVGDLENESSVYQAIARPQLSMGSHIAIVQIVHALDNVVDERHAKVPVQLDGLVLQHILQTAPRAIFGEDEHGGSRQIDAGAHETHRILVAHIPRLLDLPEELRRQVHLLHVHLLDGHPFALELANGGVHLRRQRREAGYRGASRVDTELLQRDVLHIQALQASLRTKHATHLDEDIIGTHAPGHIIQLLAELHLPEISASINKQNIDTTWSNLLLQKTDDQKNKAQKKKQSKHGVHNGRNCHKDI